jgi:hypothetical protein
MARTNKGDDPIGWGRWKGVQVIGRKKNINYWYLRTITQYKENGTGIYVADYG